MAFYNRVSAVFCARRPGVVFFQLFLYSDFVVDRAVSSQAQILFYDFQAKPGERFRDFAGALSFRAFFAAQR